MQIPVAVRRSGLSSSLLALILALLLPRTSQAQLPPQRSTRYDGSAAVTMQHAPAVYAPNLDLTIEAWVYREDDTRCETIVSHDFTKSFWFGFCGNTLRFYRNANKPIDAGRNVPARRWTHVAATYNGFSQQARFYLDGQLVTTKAVAAANAPLDLPLYLGMTPAVGLFGSTYPFKGALDEVRIWARALTASELGPNRFAELTAGDGLVAAFPAGGEFEAVASRNATALAGATKQIAGILPRDLVVPQTRRTMILDGNPSAAEFAGAEQLVVRYLDGANEVDTVARLILRQRGAAPETNLWIGLDFPELQAAPFPLDSGSLRFYCDRDASGDAVAGAEDLRFNYSVFTAAPAKSVWRGSGAGGFVQDDPLTASPSVFQPSSGFCVSEFAPACIELSVLKHWAAVNNSATAIRFMLDLFRPGKGIIGLGGTPPVTLPTPFDAQPGSAATWPRLRFGDFVEEPSSEVTLRVQVREPKPDGSFPGVTNVLVSVQDARSARLLESELTTTSGGEASFQFVLPRDTPLSLRIQAPLGWEYLSSQLADSGETPPTTHDATSATYPGCAAGSCRYRDLFFFLRRPPGPTRFTSVEPTSYWPELILRDSPSQKRVEPSLVTLLGENLHSRMAVYAYDGLSPLLPVGSATEPPGPPTTSAQHYFPVPITEVAPDGARLTVRMNVPDRLSTVNFWIRDNWDRPEHDRYWHTAPAIRRGLPSYPEIHGFEWENFGDGHDLDDYRAAFPDLVCDPFKMVGFWAWFPIYLLSLDGAGECVGMCATSDQFARFRQTEPYDRRVHYAFGFPGDSLRPARFNVANPCSPAPENVWAQIKANHGVQLSAEFIGESLSQLYFVGTRTIMRDQYARIRAHPRGQLLCFRRSLTGSGHGVLALATRDEGTNLDGTPNPNMRDVLVYDPNWPGQIRVLHLEMNFSLFYYDGFDPPWVGNLVVVHDIRNFWEQRPRNLITLDSLGAAIDRLGARGLAELLAMLVGGDAQPLVTTAPGQQVGWKSDGAFVETEPFAVSIPQFNFIPGGKEPPAQLYLPLSNAPPQLEVNLKGKTYAVHVAHQGTMFQLFVEGGVSGDIDRVNFSNDAGRLGSLRFAPQRLRGKVTPRIALAEKGSNYVGSFAWEGLLIPAGKAAEFRALPERRGVELLNDTGAATQPLVSVVVPGVDGVQTNQFGPFTVPAGAAQGLLMQSADGKALRAELDLDRDGTPEFVSLVAPASGGPITPPTLAVSREGELIHVSWPLGPGAWALERTDQLGVGAKWTRVSEVPALVGDTVVVKLALNASARFLRLRLL